MGLGSQTAPENQSMRRYLYNLSRHPGLPIAALYSVLGAIVGAMRDGTVASVATGSLLMSIFWIPVLLTANR
jgi:hypothetical protein